MVRPQLSDRKNTLWECIQHSAAAATGSYTANTKQQMFWHDRQPATQDRTYRVQFTADFQHTHTHARTDTPIRIRTSMLIEFHGLQNGTQIPLQCNAMQCTICLVSHLETAANRTPKYMHRFHNGDKACIIELVTNRDTNYRRCSYKWSISLEADNISLSPFDV